MTVRPIPNMVNHETNELFFENLEIPAENLIGTEGQGLPIAFSVQRRRFVHGHAANRIFSHINLQS